MIKKTYPITEKILKNGLDLSLKLLDILNKEANSLERNMDSATIAKVAANKKEIVGQLDQVFKQFTQILATEKLEMNSSGIAEYFKKAEEATLETSILVEQWKEIAAISKQCRALNEKNGASINLLAQHTQRVLHILKGKSEQATTYGPDGSTYCERLSQALASV